MMARETSLDGAITRSPRASEALNAVSGQKSAGNRSGKDVTRNTGMRSMAAMALQAAPALCACTMSTRSLAISFASRWALSRMRSGLNVSVRIGSHSPPAARSSPAGGPLPPATIARAPDCSTANALSSAPRPGGSSRSAGASCKMVMPASDRRLSPPGPINGSPPLRSGAACGEKVRDRISRSSSSGLEYA